MFYGFMRHSIMLALLTLPIKHPVRMAIVASLGHMVEQQQKARLQEQVQGQLQDWYYKFAMWKYHHSDSFKKAIDAQGPVSNVLQTWSQRAAAHFRLEENHIPFPYMGNYIMPNGFTITFRNA